MPAEMITLCGGEYMVSPVSSEPIPGYVALEPTETRMIVRGWMWRREVAVLSDLLAALGSWHELRPLAELESFMQLVELRFDDYCPALVLHRRELASARLASSSAGAGETAVSLSDLASRSEPEERLTGWIEIVLRDSNGKPVPHARYELRLGDRELRQGYLDTRGFARIEGIPEGTCEVCFPDFDRSSWSHA